MDAKTFIQSWAGLWLWMQYLTPRIVGSRIQTAYTYRKGRLDLEIRSEHDSLLLSWEKQGNRVLLSASDRFSTPKKKVLVFTTLALGELTIKGISLNAADRALKLSLSNGLELIFGAYPQALNVYAQSGEDTLETFLKSTGQPGFDPEWIGPDNDLPDPLPLGRGLPFDLARAPEGLELDEENGTVGLKADREGSGLTIAELTHAVQRQAPAKKQVNVQSIWKTATNVKKRWKRKLGKVSEELSAAENWPELEQQMQALQLSQAFGIMPVHGRVSLSAEQSPTGKAVSVPVDAQLKLSENIALLAKRIRKNKEKLETLTHIIPQIESDIETLLKLMESEDEEQLKAFLVSKGEALERDGSQRVERKPYKQYSSPGGYDILVGRTSSDNDTLTFKIAAKNDWWFHARQIRGSHVILRCGKTEPEPADIYRAAELAAQNSKAKHSGIVVVQYCQRKHLSKPKGSSPGTVLVHQEQSITVDLTDIEES